MQSTTGLASKLGVARTTIAHDLLELRRRGNLARGFRPITERQARTLVERKKRRPKVLEGVAMDKTLTMIGSELGVSFAVVSLDIKAWRFVHDPELAKAERTRDRIREERRLKPKAILERAEKEGDAYFMETQGLTMAQVNQLNMANFYRGELLALIENPRTRIEQIDRLTLKRAGLIHQASRTGGWLLTWDACAALFLLGVKNPSPRK